MKYLISVVLLGLFLMSNCIAQPTSIIFKENNITMYPTWKYPPLSCYQYSNNSIVVVDPGTLSWTSSNNTIATVLSNGDVNAKAPGNVTLTATGSGVSGTLNVTIKSPIQGPQYLPNIDLELTTPADCYKEKMKVAIINYMPTNNGTAIDLTETGTLTVQPIPLQVNTLKTWLTESNIQMKHMLEERTKFRGYKDPTAEPYLGYEVVQYINVYEPMPRYKPITQLNGTKSRLIDYNSIADRFNWQYLVNGLDVDEIWIWGYHTDDVVGWESNMSSPATGDKSNNDQDNTDMPVFGKTYIAYWFNYGRHPNLHNQGHHLESIFYYLDFTFFREKFVGWQGSTPPIGRCGDTHHPPNTTMAYDYFNTAQVLSDVEDWLPNGGPKKLINNDTWGTIDYNWPNNNPPAGEAEANYYIYWMQNFPGFNNGIPYNSFYMNNWWRYISNWDQHHNSPMFGNYPPLPETNVNGCTCVLQATVTVTHVTCNSQGSASAFPAHGFPPYTYSWSNGSSNASIYNVPPGNYTVNITDGLGCTASKQVTINDHCICTLGLSVNANNTTCTTLGSASATPFSGAAPYTFQWSVGNATTNTIGNLQPGNYGVTVTDGNGCKAVKVFAISNGCVCNIIATTSVTNADCFTNGSIVVYANQGTAPYSYSWNNGQTTQTAVNLPAGTYTVGITDVNGCQTSTSATVVKNCVCSAYINITPTHVTCSDLGSATANVYSGLSPYTYSWSNGQTTKTIINLSPGTYTVNIIDANGCTASKTVNILNNCVCNLGASVNAIGTTCSSLGSATVTPVSGVSPYTYQWSVGNSSTNNVNNLQSGNYAVTVTDGAGCKVIKNFTIADGCICNMTSTVSINHTDCFNNGSATALSQNGASPLSYAWSNGQTTITAINLVPGTYQVTVTDANGCTVVKSATIIQNCVCSTYVTIAPTHKTCNANGSATANVFSGLAPYTYSWNNGQSTKTINNLVPGTYTVNVSDANGCSAMKSVTIVNNCVCNLTATISSTHVSCTSDGSATANPGGGTAPFTYSWNTGQNTKTINNLLPGTYQVNITDVNNCAATSQVVILDNCVCPTTLMVSETHNAGTAETHHAGTTLYDSNVIKSGADVDSKAGSIIYIKDGFRANYGSSYNAKIETCTPKQAKKDGSSE